jgi:uncharacterized protein YcaQ
VRHDPALVDSLLQADAERGPSTARDLDDGLPRAKVHWGWNWSATKKVLEHLFASGRLAVAGRNSAFERVFDLPERVLPPEVLATPRPSDAEAHLELVRRAARSHGIGTLNDLRDYYRMHVDEVRPAVATLLETGELERVSVEGWSQPAYHHRDARRPRRVQARALLSPFDPLVWQRARTENLFDFFYRIEIYTPAAKRVHGYYVLPFLLGEHVVGRVDLKADRPGRALLVKGAWSEPHAPPEAGEELAQELLRLAGWLGLDTIRVDGRGDLAEALSAAVPAA